MKESSSAIKVLIALLYPIGTLIFLGVVSLLLLIQMNNPIYEARGYGISGEDIIGALYWGVAAAAVCLGLCFVMLRLYFKRFVYLHKDYALGILLGPAYTICSVFILFRFFYANNFPPIDSDLFWFVIIIIGAFAGSTVGGIFMASRMVS